MPHLSLRFLDEEDGKPCPHSLELAANNGRLAVRGRSLPGTERMCVALDEEGTVRRRWEIAVDGAEDVVFHLEVDEEGSVELTSDGRVVYLLPPDAQYEPSPTIPRPASPEEALDVAVLFDATTRAPSGEGELSGFLLDASELRDDFFGRLETLLERVTERYADVWMTAFAFGDHEMPRMDVQADELKPRFLLYPERRDKRKLRSMAPAELVGLLRDVPSTSGGDFVDALAHGLWAAGELRWRLEARKVLIVVGDSPGHSTEHPLPPEADVCTRFRDVDVEAMCLHRQGVEIVTIYHDPPSGTAQGNAEVRRFLEAARDQYARLASYSAVALKASSFDPLVSSEAVLGRPPLIGHRSAYGLLVEPASPC